MKNLGDFASQATIDFKFTTAVNGKPTALTSGAISVYKDNNTTQTTTGVTLTASFDSVTGLNHVRIVTTDSFYATGSNYSVVITSGTVNGVSVAGHTIAEFSIENRVVDVARLGGDTDAGTRLKQYWQYIDANARTVFTQDDTLDYSLMSGGDDYSHLRTIAIPVSGTGAFGSGRYVKAWDGLLAEMTVEFPFDTALDNTTELIFLPCGSPFLNPDDSGLVYLSSTGSTNSSVIQTGVNAASSIAALTAYVDELESRLTAARAGYLDNLNVGGNVASAADLATVEGYVDDLESRLTASRAGYLDNLNVGGSVASQADVSGITQAQRVRIIVPPQFERPDSSSTTFRIWIYVYDELHEAEDLDSNPTVTAENNAGTDRSSNLGTVTKPGATTGQYYVDYTVADSHAIEGLVFKVSATEGSTTTVYAASTVVVDTTAVDFATADRTKLEAIFNKLPSKSYLTGTGNSDGDVDMSEATGNYPGSVASVLALGSQAKLDVNAEVDTALSDYDGPTYLEILNFFRIVMRSDAAIATDLSSALGAINADLGSGAGDYDNTADALEALAAGLGGGGLAFTDSVPDPGTSGTIGRAFRQILDYLDQQVSLQGGGAGSVTCTLTVKDVASQPISGAEVWITTDSDGLNLVAGTKVTDDFGIVTMYLDPGTYYRWADHSAHSFDNPQEFTVT